MNKVAAAFILSGLIFGGVVAAQQTVTANQGAPGNQGPWKITGTVTAASAAPDGGVASRPVQCNPASTHTNVVVGAASTAVPVAQTVGRVWVQICNSLQNGGSTVIKCRADAVAPVFAAGNAGDVLNTGDCVQYALTSSVIPLCIANGAGANVTTFQCVP